MQLLVVSNYFPPCFIGGYELGCRDVIEGLKAHGHSATVLTSNYRRGDATEDSEVLRLLPLDDGTTCRLLWHLRSALTFLRLAFSLRPNVIYFWNQSGLSLWLAPLARLFRFRCVFFLSDTSFVSWRVGAFFSKSDRAGHRVINGIRCHFASEFLRRYAGMTERSSAVMHWGIDPVAFPFEARAASSDKPFKLLYVGQIIPQKGVHIAVDATALLLASGGSGSLTIVGGSSKPDYLAELKNIVSERGLDDRIHFVGKRPRSDLPSLYRDHDLLILPSIWDEPFAITPLEAMASGLPVVATNTGGSAEIFRDRENCLIVPVANAEACASAILELRSNRVLYERIRSRGHELVVSSFTIERMVALIEQDLEGVATA